MKLNGREFDTVDGTEDKLFNYMDTLEKEVVTKNIARDGIPEYDENKHCLLLVYGHAILLPKEAKEMFESEGWIEYLED
ncbi:MAG: hypothetical protein ACLFTH_02565 [Candidatus Woesearchaeota archaeon]